MVTLSMVTETTDTGDRNAYFKVIAEKEHDLFFCVFSI